MEAMEAIRTACTVLVVCGLILIVTVTINVWVSANRQRRFNSTKKRLGM